jgi:hypothetical protein
MTQRLVAPSDGPNDDCAYEMLNNNEDNRKVIQRLITTILRIDRQYKGHPETLKLNNDIKDFFMESQNFRVKWLDGPDNDPKETVNILQTFIDRVDEFIDDISNDRVVGKFKNINDIVLHNEWNSVHADLQSVKHYYYTEASSAAMNDLSRVRGPNAPGGPSMSRYTPLCVQITDSIYAALVKQTEENSCLLVNDSY